MQYVYMFVVLWRSHPKVSTFPEIPWNMRLTLTPSIHDSVMGEVTLDLNKEFAHAKCQNMFGRPRYHPPRRATYNIVYMSNVCVCNIIELNLI